MLLIFSQLKSTCSKEDFEVTLNYIYLSCYFCKLRQFSHSNLDSKNHKTYISLKNGSEPHCASAKAICSHKEGQYQADFRAARLSLWNYPESGKAAPQISAQSQ